MAQCFSMQTWITSHLPATILTLACFGLFMLTVVVVLTLLHFAINKYNKVLQVWSPKGWYYSCCLLVSDMARGKAWHVMHVSRVASLLLGLKEENPTWFAQLMAAVNAPTSKKPLAPVAPINGASSQPQSSKHVERM